jgi:hypothetical protein
MNINQMFSSIFFEIDRSLLCHGSDIHIETKSFFGFLISMIMSKKYVEIVFDF